VLIKEIKHESQHFRQRSMVLSALRKAVCLSKEHGKAHPGQDMGRRWRRMPTPRREGKMNRNTLKQAIACPEKAPDKESLRKSIGPEAGPKYGRLEEEESWQRHSRESSFTATRGTGDRR
jgi:hypothetical protein